MHQKLAVALAALFITLSPAQAADEFPPTSDAVQKYFQIACTYIKDGCGDVTAPMVIFKDTSPALGYYHFGTHVVFIQKDCLWSPVADQTLCEAVLIHEMIHYIAQHRHGLVDNCKSEEAAWWVYNHYVKTKGRPDLLRENWVESYPRCQQ